MCLVASVMQSKKANFDASHELEELLLEDNPLKARQRKVQDINNLSVEMRQMEEQCVSYIYPNVIFSSCAHRFTSYDFKKMQRRSYYPQNNPQIVSTVTATSSSGVVSSRPVTPATIPDGTGALESVNGSAYGHKPSHEIEEVTMDSQAVPMGDITNEKIGYVR